MTTSEYNQCVEEYADGLFRFALKQLANRADAADVVQNTFEKMWIHREKVVFEKAKSYAFTVAYRQLIDVTRKRKRTSLEADLPERAHGDFQSSLESRDLINLGLEKLPDIQKSLILLRDYEGYAYDEIAEITELSISQVKVYLFRARKKMQQVINQLNKAV